MNSINEITEIILLKYGNNKIVTDKDINDLEMAVCKDLKIENALSVNTWKRLFGMLQRSEKHNFAPRTLKIISLYLECDSWEELVENIDTVRHNFSRTSKNISDFVPDMANRLKIQHMHKGDTIRITYSPKRTVEAELIDKNTFRVVFSQNSMLIYNDVFTAYNFTKGDIFRAYDVKRSGNYIGSYFAAAHHRIEDVCIKHAPKINNLI